MLRGNITSSQIAYLPDLSPRPFLNFLPLSFRSTLSCSPPPASIFGRCGPKRTDYIERLLLLAPFVINAQGTMQNLLDDPGFTFWLFVKTTTTSEFYGSLVNEECLPLRSVLNVPDVSFTGKKDGERLSGCLADAFDVEAEEKSNAFASPRSTQKTAPSSGGPRSSTYSGTRMA